MNLHNFKIEFLSILKILWNYKDIIGLVISLVVFAMIQEGSLF